MPGIRISRLISGGGLTLEGSATRTPDQVVAVGEVTLGLGKAGTLTGRTDANTGVATLSGGHGIISTQHVDIYWATGMRFDMVATVSGNAVTVDGGSGDDLPSTTTAVVVAPRVEVDVMIVAAPLVFAAQAKRDDPASTAKAHVEIWNTEETIGRIGLEGNLPRVTDCVVFGSGFSEANPNGNNPGATVYASNGSSSETATLQIIVGQDSTP